MGRWFPLCFERPRERQSNVSRSLLFLNAILALKSLSRRHEEANLELEPRWVAVLVFVVGDRVSDDPTHRHPPGTNVSPGGQRVAHQAG